MIKRRKMRLNGEWQRVVRNRVYELTYIGQHVEVKDF